MMRKKTKSFLIGLFIGTLIMGTACCGVYYYFGFIDKAKTIGQYELLLDEFKNPPQVKVYRLTKDVKQNEELTISDYEILSIPQTLSNQSEKNVNEDIIGLVPKIDLDKGMILYQNMLVNKSEIPSDLRIIELSNLVTQMLLNEGQHVDVRISFPSGLDYVVLAKKELKKRSVIESDSGNKEVLTFYLNEDEQLRLSSALVDAYLREGTYLYSTIYVEADSQEAAVVTYPANEDVQNLIENDPNIVKRAIVALEKQKRVQLSESLTRLPSNIIRDIPLVKVNNPEEATEPQETDLSDVN
jgi:hypothetical protein